MKAPYAKLMFGFLFPTNFPSFWRNELARILIILWLLTNLHKKFNAKWHFWLSNYTKKIKFGLSYFIWFILIIIILFWIFWLIFFYFESIWSYFNEKINKTVMMSLSTLVKLTYDMLCHCICHVINQSIVWWYGMS